VVAKFMGDITYTKAEKDEFIIKIFNKLTSDFSTSINLYSVEEYFSIEMNNLAGKCLNTMIIDEKSRLNVRKPKKPSNTRLKRRDMPKQSASHANSEEKYRVYVNGGMDSFYVFNAHKINSIQSSMNDLGEAMSLKLHEEFEQIDYGSEGEQVELGDLVLAKSEDEDQWYRCIVSDFNAAKNRFSVFSVDLGNTFTVERNDLMYAWTEEQARLLSQHEPQAYRCQLYALLPLGSKTGKCSELKEIVANKEFNVRFLHSFTDEKTATEGLKYDVCLSETNPTNSAGLFASVHLRLVEQAHGKLST
jgi:hypothetical protein